MDTRPYINQNNINMRKIPCIPIMSTSTINIHLPIGAMMSQQPNNNNNTPNHLMMSRGSEGSSASASPPSSPSRSASSSRSSPPVTPQYSKMMNGLKLTNDDTFETDSAVGSFQEDNRSLQSMSSQGGDVGFNSETSSVGLGVDSEDRTQGHSVAAIYMDREVALMVKVLCQSEETCRDSRFITTMRDVIKACGLHCRRESTVEEFNSVAVNKMKLKDQRPAKEHIAELSRELGKSVTISETVFRRLTDSREYVGTFVHDVVKAEGSCTIARVGAMVTLKKMNKIAPAREFSDQLCEHMLTTKPAILGNKIQALEQQKLKTQQRDNHRFHVHPKELLSQTFIFDPTINVAEAARRSFVEVTDFFLYE